MPAKKLASLKSFDNLKISIRQIQKIQPSFFIKTKLEVQAVYSYTVGLTTKKPGSRSIECHAAPDLPSVHVKSGLKLNSVRCRRK
jgi:hypothetical protein